ncbi:hypothetical protein B0H13DRAFT_2328220 [Mycena leptocephala]|nr:hypothetical protein B0H13DRAFT_2328220 [Mycena leptocephala]
MSDASLSPSDSSLSSCSSPSDTSSPRSLVLSEDLPLPTAPRPFTTKKSHARKQPLGHIPRPRNAFILFRCDYSRQNERTTRDQDQNDVSRTVGNIWRSMTEEQRAPWVYLAEAEKKRHATLYPGYKYTPRRNRKFKPTEEEVEKQIEKEAEKVVEAEARRIAEENTKDLVTVYYPPWATRRTLTYFARRATSCPPEGAISVEPYSETLDRAMVTTSVKAAPKEDVEKEECLDKEEQSPSETVENVFVPSAYGIYDEDISCSSQSPPSWSIRPDQSLSQWSYTINPPGGTTSWGEEPPSPSEYPPPSASTQYAFHEQTEQLCVPSFFYTQQGEFAMSPYAGLPSSGFGDQSDYENRWSPELPALQPPSPNDTSASSSPITPTEHPMFPGSGTIQSVENADASSSRKIDFLTEYGNVFQPEWATKSTIPTAGERILSFASHRYEPPTHLTKECTHNRGSTSHPHYWE